jgi:hypothetical protein
MRQPSHPMRALALACALCSASLAAHAQASGDHAVAPAVAHKQAAEIARGDPARWYKADSTDAARMRTLKKEIAAAYTEARHACQRSPAARRASCLKEARSTWQHDLANAPAQLAAAPAAESFSETVTMMGSSQSGQTQSGAANESSSQGQPASVVEQGQVVAPQPQPQQQLQPEPQPQQQMR